MRPLKVRVLDADQVVGCGHLGRATESIYTRGPRWVCGACAYRYWPAPDPLQAARDAAKTAPDEPRRPKAAENATIQHGNHAPEGRTHQQVMDDYRARGDDVSAGQGRV